MVPHSYVIFLLTHHCIHTNAEDKLAESSAANATLAAQIEEMTPQLSSLEKALADAKAELSKEREMRRSAELAQDEAEAKARELEGTVTKLREENDDAIEQLAFREEELEEVRLELEVERERYEAELEEARNGVSPPPAPPLSESEETEEIPSLGLVSSDITGSNGTDALTPTSASGGTDADASDLAGAESDDYIQQLEDELENVTEQLIEAETRASELEGKLADAEKASEDAALLLADTEERLVEAEAKVAEATDRDAEAGEGGVEALRSEIQELKSTEERQREELELTTEELTLVQEEMKAAEEDLKAAIDSMTAIKADHKVELEKLEAEVEAARSEAQSAQSETDSLKAAVQEANEESEGLREEIENLTKALENAKADRDRVLEEMDDLKAAFDEAEKLAEESAGPKEEALRKELMDTHAREVEELKEEVSRFRLILTCVYGARTDGQSSHNMLTHSYIFSYSEHYSWRD